MSFLVRQISRTADGREIIRAQPHEGPVITIGRQAECEVQLPDLAVEMHHASVTFLENGALEITALTGLGFELDGQKTTQARVDPAIGAELRFASHMVRIAKDGAYVTLTAEKISALSGNIDEASESTLFTLKGLLPGRRASAWSLLVLVLAVFLAWPIASFVMRAPAPMRGPALALETVKAPDSAFHPDSLWNSGPLSSAHSALKNDCKACHVQPFVSVRDSSCATCHSDVHNHADPKRLARAKAPPTLFGKASLQVAAAFNRPEGRCIECHTEHEGAGPMTATAQQFCTDCHGDLNARLPDTKIANAGDFGTAHPQFKPRVGNNPGDPLQTARISLDQRPVDNSGLKFPHAMHLSATNGVAKMARTVGGQFGFGSALACKDCHVKTADGVRFMPVTMETNCQMCHSLGVERIGDTVRTLRHGDPKMVVADLRAFYRSGGPFRAPAQQMLEGRSRPGVYAASQRYYAYFGSVNYGRADAAIRAVFSRGGACYDCHAVSAPPAGSDNWGIGKVRQTMRYMDKGWFDHSAHKTERCGSCHNAATSKSASELLLPGIKTCRTCHGGEASHAAVPSSCATCHGFHNDEEAPWKPQKRKDKIGNDYSAAHQNPQG